MAKVGVADLIEQIDKAVRAADWGRVADLCERVLGVQPDNSEAAGVLRMARRHLAIAESGEAQEALPESFGGARYAVKGLPAADAVLLLHPGRPSR